MTTAADFIDNCSKFAKQNSLKFSTNPIPKLSKTKCIIFSKNVNERVNVTPIILNGDPLPWVQEVLHLGHHLECDGSMKIDIAMKRGRFIGKVTSLKQEFHFVTPEVKMNLFNIYTKSFYGSNLWNINSNECQRLYSSWNIAVRECFQISRLTHRYLIEEISQFFHPLVDISSRLVKFDKSLTESTKPAIRILATVKRKDCRTSHGTNMKFIANRCDISSIDDLTPHLVKSSMRKYGDWISSLKYLTSKLMPFMMKTSTEKNSTVCLNYYV